MLEASMVRDEGMAKTLVQRLNRIRSGADTMAGPLVSYTGADTFSTTFRFQSEWPAASPIGSARSPSI